MKRKFKLKKKLRRIILITLLIVVVLLSTGLFIYSDMTKSLKLSLNGKSEITLNYKEEYKEQNAKASYKKDDLTSSIKVKGSVNTEKLGDYTIIYSVKHKYLIKTKKRIVHVVDKEEPVITLKGNNEETLIKGNDYNEIGFTAIDNVDGDLSEKVKVENNINKDEIGEYTVTYKVSDKSGNEATLTRKVIVIEKPPVNMGIPVLNYHFFYDSTIGEVCGDGNCEDTVVFRKQLDYLRDNGYKTLTMKEFRDWMYGEIELPEKSILITIDDGAAGTGKHNGNKLIPILEEYKMHATLFLITGWWAIDNYKSDYLDIESHTSDMHTERFCEGVTRGAKMLCLSNEQVLNDLKSSIAVTNSKLAFCFPFYAYTENAINLVKEAGFDLAFIGGGYSATRQMDKYKVPRYQIKQSTSMETFINYVS